jgi:hypothetical protein
LNTTLAKAGEMLLDAQMLPIRGQRIAPLATDKVHNDKFSKAIVVGPS